MYNLTENGAASDGVFNTWRWPKEQQKRLLKGERIVIDGTTPDPHAKRLDYIFVGNGVHKGASCDPKWHVHHIRVGMTERHPTIGCSLSDHFSIEATLSRSLGSSNIAENEGRADLGGTGPIQSQQDAVALDLSTYDIILSMIEKYTRRERRQRRFRLANFGLSVIVAIGCFTAIWWSPRPFVSFLLILLSTLGFGAGVLDGLIGGLFIGSEIRALKEFEWEIRNTKDLAVARAKESHDQEVAIKDESAAGS
jgi:sphingomyelin phosphodiesterase 2